MKAGKKDNNKSLSLAVYFGLLVFLIIVVSVVFKVIDLARSSKFDGKNRLTVAFVSDKHIDLISVSPQDGTLVKLVINNVSKTSSLKKDYVPIDAHINVDSDFNSSVKSYFIKAFFRMSNIKTNLTVFDLIRLSMYSGSVSKDKINSKTVDAGDSKKLSVYAGSLFIDPKISEEKVAVQITNSADVPGLGNSLAKYISNIGGNVVLVNTSQNPEEKSRIYYRDDSYTLKKLSKVLDLKPENKDIGSISDIIIVIGKDRQNLLEQ